MNNVLRNNGERLTLTFKEEFKLNSVLSEYKKKCRCGHTQIVLKKYNKEFDICTHCGCRLYSDDNKQKEYNKKRDKEEFVSKFKNYLSGEGRGIIEI